MNQERIGKFIQIRRKERGLTQEQLSERLGVSINAVSKWERGICLMDMSLLKPLSEILEVSVNDLLAGEFIKDQELKEKSDENLINISNLYVLKGIKSGTIAMLVVGILIIIYSLIKNMEAFGYVSMFLAFSSIAFYKRYRLTNDKLYYFYFICNLIGCISSLINFIITTS